MTLNGEVSTAVNGNWVNGPIESRVGLELGMILRNDTETKNLQDSTAAYFPSYKSMTKLQDKMAKEIE